MKSYAGMRMTGVPSKSISDHLKERLYIDLTKDDVCYIVRVSGIVKIGESQRKPGNPSVSRGINIA